MRFADSLVWLAAEAFNEVTEDKWQKSVDTPRNKYVEVELLWDSEMECFVIRMDSA